MRVTIEISEKDRAIYERAARCLQRALGRHAPSARELMSEELRLRSPSNIVELFGETHLCFTPELHEAYHCLLRREPKERAKPVRKSAEPLVVRSSMRLPHASGQN